MKFLRNFSRVIVLSGKRYVTDQLGQRAVALTYYTLFSIVPLAALLFGIAKGFSLENQLQEAISSRFANHQDGGHLFVVLDGLELDGCAGVNQHGIGLVQVIRAHGPAGG